MKRKGIFAGLALFIFLTMLAASTAVCAQENEGQSGSRIVLETVVKGQPAMVENNKAETVLPDGTAVTVEGETLTDGLLLVLELVSMDNGDVLAWIERCMQGKGTNLRAYDIYFVDNNGKRYELTGQITVTISLNGAYTNPAVYYIPESGIAEKLAVSVREDRISFVTDHNSYYVLAESADEGIKPVETPTEMPVSPEETEYPAVSGENSKWTGDGSTGITVTIPEEAGAVTKVTVDGKELSGTEYTVTGTPPTVTLTPEYLKTLGNGGHTVRIQGEKGYVETSFTIDKSGAEPTETPTVTAAPTETVTPTITAATETPTVTAAPAAAKAPESASEQSTGAKTGDETNIILWITLMLCSLSVLFTIGYMWQKKE